MSTKKTGSTNKNPHSVAVGQFWKSTAGDQLHIPFRIVGVDLHKGTARVLTEYTRDNGHGKQVTFGQERDIRLDRFKPGSRGYERTEPGGAPILSKEPVTKPEPVINIPPPPANEVQATESPVEPTHPQPPASA